VIGYMVIMGAYCVTSALCVGFGLPGKRVRRGR
jgi:hypothetical protein